MPPPANNAAAADAAALNEPAVNNRAGNRQLTREQAVLLTFVKYGLLGFLAITFADTLVAIRRIDQTTEETMFVLKHFLSKDIKMETFKPFLENFLLGMLSCSLGLHILYAFSILTQKFRLSTALTFITVIITCVLAIAYTFGFYPGSGMMKATFIAHLGMFYVTERWQYRPILETVVAAADTQ